jgi:hypothetical protein
MRGLRVTSAVSRDTSRLCRSGWGSKHNAKVPASITIVRLESQGFPELADSLSGAALLVERGAQVVVELGALRFQAEGFLVLSNRLVLLAYPA